jgi:uncharacterized protein HemX
MLVPVYAQEATSEATPVVEPTAAAVETLPESSPVAGVAEETDGQANGVTTLVLLVGLGAIGLVGAGILLRNNARSTQASQE